MKINMIKGVGGSLTPADEMEAEKLTKFKNFETYEVNVKLTRNPAFLRKVMTFFKFCFNHWDGETMHPHTTNQEQFDRFRKDLTILAGFYVQTTRLNGDIRLEAESLAFANMTEERFQECYLALTQAAMKHIFKSCDNNTYQQLLSFF